MLLILKIFFLIAEKRAILGVYSTVKSSIRKILDKITMWKLQLKSKIKEPHVNCF